MRRGALVIMVIVGLALGIGYYRGWYSLSRDESRLGNQIDLKMTIDRDQFNRDTQPAPATRN
jgi:hypothetical protein